MSEPIFSEQSIRILRELEEGSGHVFVTGKAGTGKSTLLQHFRLHTKIPLVVLAPTGVAAVHIGGETIHSFFRFAPNVTKKEARSNAHFAQERDLYRKLEMIIIDEISMVRADLLDCVDVFLRAIRDDDRTFGGVRMIFFGDLYQLPPVVTSQEYLTFRTIYPSEWFFDSQVMIYLLESETESLKLFELTTIYRQADPEFIDLLAAIRSKTATDEQLAFLNSRVKPVHHTRHSMPITLTARRDTAATLNQEHLLKLPGTAVSYDGQSQGKFPDGHLPTNTQLTLKIGARVMFVANDPTGRFVNGTLATVKKLKPESVVVRIDGGNLEEIGPHTWELTHTVLSGAGELQKEKLGEFTQLPLMLAWAVTIHKAQGKTFDQVVINLEGGAFAHGQVYVALSRATTLAGITLTAPLKQQDVRMHGRVNQFLCAYAVKQSTLTQSREEKYQRIEDAIEMGTQVTLTYLRRPGEESIQKITPEAVGMMSHAGKSFLGLSARSNSGRLLTYNAERILAVV